MALMLFGAAAYAQPAPRLLKVQGIAFDSVGNRPLAGALVAVPSIRRSAVSDARGRFTIDSVPEGEVEFTLQHDVLDSLGIPGVTSRASVHDRMPTLRISTPSFSTLWRRACGDTAPGDSTLVYGNVQFDGPPRSPGSSQITASWTDLVGGGKTLSSVAQRRYHRAVPLDERDNYAMCGVPTGIELTLSVTLTANDSVPLLIVPVATSSSRVRRRDLLVALPAVQAAAVSNIENTTVRPTQSDAAAAPARAYATLRGTITNAAGVPVINAVINVDSLPEVRSGPDGAFTVPRVPAGTRRVTVIYIGMLPHESLIAFHAGETVQRVIPMAPVTALAAVDVRATTVSTRIRGYEERKRAGFGNYRDSTEIKKYPGVAHVLRTMPSVVIPQRGGLERLRLSSECAGDDQIDVRIDGHQAYLAALDLFDTKDIAAMEVYRRRSSLPSELMSSKKKVCAIWVWTHAGFGKK